MSSNPPEEQHELAESAPTYLPGPRQLADPAIPVDVWEQDVPQGGASVDGTMPTKALAVGVVGIASVRSAPALSASSGSVVAAPGFPVRIAGRVPQRRRLVIAATLFPALVSHDQMSAQTGQGFTLPQGVPFEILSASEVWVSAPGATDSAFVSFWSELDLG